MGLNTPSRKPSFHRLYPTKKAFDEDRARFAASAAKPKSTMALPHFDPAVFADMLASTEIPSRFSTRVLGDYLLAKSSTHIVSEHEGLIERLLITVPRDSKYEDGVDPKDARHFKTLLKHLGGKVEYVILHSSNQRATIESWAADAQIPAGRLRLVSSPVFNYSIWAQDAYVALIGSTGTSVLCEGVSFPRNEDMTIADDVATQTDIATVGSYLHFQGGNVLGGKDLTLMGMDYIQRNVGRYNLESMQDVLHAFKKLWGSNILPLGGLVADYDSIWWQNDVLSGYGYQPLFHIDMYVTPTGVPGKNGKPIVLLGSPAKAREVVGAWNEAGIRNGDVYDSFFELTEEQLSKHFDVRKIPLWLVRGNLGKSDWSDRYYVLTWNNAVVQNDGQTRKVLLPNFADAHDCVEYNVDRGVRQQLQAAAEHAWRELKFEVSVMDGLEELAYNLGSVHCMTKTLKRTAT